MSTDVFPFAVWLAGTNQNSIPANDNALRVEVITGPALSIESTQPGSPAEGDQYILGAAPTGAQWAAFDEDDVVIFKGGTWLAFAPYQGWLKFNADDGDTYQWDAGWAVFAGGGGGGAVDSVNGQTGTVVLELDDLDDVDVPSPTDGDVLTWDNTAGEWIAAPAPGAGSGSVTSVSASGGVETTSGSAITTTGTIQAATLVNPQTGTSYTYLTGDRGKLVTHSNASAIAGTLPQATSTFGSGWFMRVKNKGAGTLTITPTTSTIDGAATLVLTTGQWAVVVSDGTNYQSTTYAPAGGGGVTGFTSSLNTSGVNSTVNVSMLLASGGTTNQHAAFSPKGTGGVFAQLPDSSTAGGNGRGANCVDWQTSRSAATQVAQSLYSTISGGAENTASNTYATVGGGRANVASLDYSVVSGGWANTASGLYSGVTNGRDNVASGQQSRVGGSGGNARGIMGADIYGLTIGNQRGAYGLQRNTVNTATQATATVDYNGTPSTANQIVLANNMAMTFVGYVVAKASGSTDAKHWKFEGGIVRGANAGTTALTAAVTASVISAAAGASAWAVDIDADTTLGCLRVKVTGDAANNINWTVVVAPTAETVI
jgi:hypothetical protein